MAHFGLGGRDQAGEAGARTASGEKTVAVARVASGEKTVAGERTASRDRTASGERTVAGERTAPRDRTISAGRTVTGDRTVSGDPTVSMLKIRSLAAPTDEELERRWLELADVTFNRSPKTDELVLCARWWIFRVGTERKKIWSYFDEHHSKGVWHLLQNVSS